MHHGCAGGSETSNIELRDYKVDGPLPFHAEESPSVAMVCIGGKHTQSELGGTLAGTATLDTGHVQAVGVADATLVVHQQVEKALIADKGRAMLEQRLMLLSCELASLAFNEG